MLAALACVSRGQGSFVISLQPGQPRATTAVCIERDAIRCFAMASFAITSKRHDNAQALSLRRMEDAFVILIFSAPGLTALLLRSIRSIEDLRSLRCEVGIDFLCRSSEAAPQYGAQSIAGRRVGRCASSQVHSSQVHTTTNIEGLSGFQREIRIAAFCLLKTLGVGAVVSRSDSRLRS